MITVRCGRGLGDSIYLRVLVDEYIRFGDQVTALSNYPDVFIESGARVEPFTRISRAKAANYTHRMHLPETQWSSILRSVSLSPDLPLRFTWNVQNAGLVDRLRRMADGRPMLIVHGGHMPMQRGDAWTRDLIPRRDAFQWALDALSECFTVRVGASKDAYGLKVDRDLNGSTSVSDLIDLFSVCDAVITQCSFAMPLAECFDKPLLGIWSASGLHSRTSYLRTVTPAKVLSKPTSHYVVDDSPSLWSSARAFLQSIGARANALSYA